MRYAWAMPNREGEADLAAEARVMPAVLDAQAECPRHRAPCPRCQPETPRARRFANGGGSVCACGDEPCACGLTAFLVAEGASAFAAIALMLAARKVFVAVAAPVRS